MSRLILGTDFLWKNPLSLEGARATRRNDATRVLEAAFELGINAFDTAAVYASERLLGFWLKQRKNRERVTLVSKCGHPNLLTRRPRLSFEQVTADIVGSLKRLNTDHIDLMLVHYDAEHVPAAEIIDWLYEHKTRGNITAFGLSNWTLERIRAAEEYARVGLKWPMSAVSPQFSLVCWRKPMWAGAVSASGEPGATLRTFCADKRLALLAWSPLGRGYFVGREGSQSRIGWFNRLRRRRANQFFDDDANRERYRKAVELARRHGTTPAQIALAFLLAQPSDVYPIIGSRRIDHLQDNAGAVALELSDQEVDWLAS